MTFDIADFLAPLDPLVIAMAVILGIILGRLLTASGYTLHRAHFVWQAGGAAVFFVPLALLRGLQGSLIWERFLATLILWWVFEAGMWLGNRR